METVEYKITGHVQGVGYRYFVWSLADELGISGSVRNCADGSVEIAAKASRSVLTQFKQKLIAGNGYSQVENVSERPALKEIPDGSFSIIR